MKLASCPGYSQIFSYSCAKQIWEWPGNEANTPIAIQSLENLHVQWVDILKQNTQIIFITYSGNYNTRCVLRISCVHVNTAQQSPTYSVLVVRLRSGVLPTITILREVEFAFALRSL